MNDPPDIHEIPHQRIKEDSALTDLKVVIDEGGGDDEDEQIIRITAASLNPELIPDEAINIEFSDSADDADHASLTIRPIAGKEGEAIIKLELTDGELKTEREFKLSVMSVNDPPEIAKIPNQETNESAPVEHIKFSVDEGGGASEDKQILEINATSSNQLLLPDENIKIEFHDDESDAEGGQLSVTPALGYFGDAVITVSVDDGKETVTETFSLTVHAVNNPPVIYNIKNQRIDEDDVLEKLKFSVDEGGAADEDAQRISLTVISNNQTIIPDKNIEVSFTDDDTDAGDGFISITPLDNMFGEVIITVTANDGEQVASHEFKVNVRSINDIPISEDLEFEVDEDLTLSGKLVGKDIDDPALRFQIHRYPQEGKLTVTGEGDGDFVYAPFQDWSGADSFSYSASDGKSDSNQATVKITVRSINDPPILSQLADQHIAEDDTFPILTFAIDEGGGDEEDDQILKVTATSSNQLVIPDKNITIDFNDDENDAEFGAISLKPVPDSFGEATITLSAMDGYHTASANFTLHNGVGYS